jgi:hypothetical protein
MSLYAFRAFQITGTENHGLNSPMTQLVTENKGYDFTLLQIKRRFRHTAGA